MTSPVDFSFEASERAITQGGAPRTPSPSLPRSSAAHWIERVDNRVSSSEGAGSTGRATALPMPAHTPLPPPRTPSPQIHGTPEEPPPAPKRRRRSGIGYASCFADDARASSRTPDRSMRPDRIGFFSMFPRHHEQEPSGGVDVRRASIMPRGNNGELGTARHNAQRSGMSMGVDDSEDREWLETDEMQEDKNIPTSEMEPTNHAPRFPNHAPQYNTDTTGLYPYPAWQMWPYNRASCSAPALELSGLDREVDRPSHDCNRLDTVQTAPPKMVASSDRDNAAVRITSGYELQGLRRYEAMTSLVMCDDEGSSRDRRLSPPAPPRLGSPFWYGPPEEAASRATPGTSTTLANTHQPSRAGSHVGDVGPHLASASTAVEASLSEKHSDGQGCVVSLLSSNRLADELQHAPQQRSTEQQVLANFADPNRPDALEVQPPEQLPVRHGVGDNSMELMNDDVGAEQEFQDGIQSDRGIVLERYPRLDGKVYAWLVRVPWGMRPE